MFYDKNSNWKVKNFDVEIKLWEIISIIEYDVIDKIRIVLVLKIKNEKRMNKSILIFYY